jgi:glycerophosphoryl diester phosphodiesterase
LNRTVAIAHRGARRDRPENTIAAFDEALRQGCDAIELDLQLSADGVPVVYHDRTLAKVGGGRKRVSQLTLKELEKLDAGAHFGRRYRGERLPTLERVLRRYARRTRLLLEMKAREEERRKVELARLTVDAIKKIGAERNVMLLSFDEPMLEAAAGFAPSLPRVLNLKPTPRLRGKLRSMLPALSALAVDIRHLTPGFASAVRSAGCPLFAFTCNRSGRVREALEAGASGIISDRPGWLVERLNLLSPER